MDLDVNVDLRPMTEAEYASFAEFSCRDYAAQIAAGRHVDHAAARQRADRDFAAILPDGRRTEGHLFLLAVDGAGAAVGHLWLALRAPGGGPGGWVYDLHVLPAVRGRGYGKAIMLGAERILGEHGVDRVGLNVFGFNTVAIALYRSLGYQVSAMQLTKPLGTVRSGDDAGE